MILTGLILLALCLFFWIGYGIGFLRGHRAGSRDACDVLDQMLEEESETVQL